MTNLQSQIDILAKAIVRNFIRNTTLYNLNDIDNLAKINEKLDNLENRLKKLENNQNNNGGGDSVACDCTLKSVDDVFSITYNNDATVNKSLHNHLSELYKWKDVTRDNRNRIDSLMEDEIKKMRIALDGYDTVRYGTFQSIDKSIKDLYLKIGEGSGGNDSGAGDSVACDCTLKSIDDEINVVVSNPAYNVDFNFNQSLLTHLEYLHSQAVVVENEGDRLRGFFENFDGLTYNSLIKINEKLNELENNQGSNTSGDGNVSTCDCTLKSVDDVFGVTYDNIYDLDNDLTVTRSLHDHLSQLYEWRSVTEDNKRRIDSLMENGNGGTYNYDIDLIYGRLENLENNQGCNCDIDFIDEKLSNLETSCTLRSVNDKINVIFNGPDAKTYNYTQSLLSHLEYLHTQSKEVEDRLYKLEYIEVSPEPAFNVHGDIIMYTEKRATKYLKYHLQHLYDESARLRRFIYILAKLTGYSDVINDGNSDATNDENVIINK